MTTDPLCPQQHTHPKHNPKLCIFCKEFAAVREDERANIVALAKRVEESQYAAGQRDEREAIDAEITADLTARIQREREDRDPDLLLGGIDYALQNVLRVIRARGE